jgi:hypothetical protein
MDGFSSPTNDFREFLSTTGPSDFQSDCSASLHSLDKSNSKSFPFPNQRSGRVRSATGFKDNLNGLGLESEVKRKELETVFGGRKRNKSSVNVNSNSLGLEGENFDGRFREKVSRSFL